MKKIYDISEAWKEYVNLVLPNGFSEMQYRQLYMAFLSGITFSLSALNEIGTNETMTEKEKEDEMFILVNQCIDLNERIVKSCQKYNLENNIKK